MPNCGKSNDASLSTDLSSIGLKNVVVGLTKSSATVDAGVVTSYGIELGGGSKGVGISKTQGNTTQTGGAKDSSEKKKQRDQHTKEQEKQKQNNRLWDWFTNNWK